MGDLIPLSSGSPDKDENLKKINQTEQEKRRIKNEIREKKRELKKMVFFFATLGAFIVPAILSYAIYNLWQKFSFEHQIVAYICIIFSIIIALSISKKIHRFLFQGLD